MIECVIGIATHGNPGDAAVAFMVNDQKRGRRVGRMTNVRADWYALEFAISLIKRRPLRVVACSRVTKPTPDSIVNMHADVQSRVMRKLEGVEIVHPRKGEDRRFALVKEFAKKVLDSSDPLWIPTPEETAEAVGQRIESELEERTESPPESVILEALSEFFSNPTIARPFKNLPGWKMPALEGPHGILIPQFKVDKYRADFAVIGNRIKIVVEVDGYTYHSSKEAFANDRRRDRELLLRGWTTVRYTATEATHDTLGCVQNVIEILEGSEE